MQMTDRPRSVREWRNWLSAFTHEGYERPGSFSMLSVCVRPDLPARIALHLRPALVEGPPGRGNGNGVSAWAGPAAVGAYR
jgi:hypothetical protein